MPLQGLLFHYGNLNTGHLCFVFASRRRSNPAATMFSGLLRFRNDNALLTHLCHFLVILAIFKYYQTIKMAETLGFCSKVCYVVP